MVDNVEMDPVFEKAAELFGVLSTPIRLRIISALCGGEKSVGQLLEAIDVAQPNMSQHLNIMYRTGVVGKRRQGAQVFYRIADESAVKVCRAVCTQVAIDAALQ
ncbi:MAG: Biofilm growth-associated repressor [Pseudomonadota bacterium]|jgi:ArsR family transcriptional regulator